jgi:hypothetical protein
MSAGFAVVLKHSRPARHLPTRGGFLFEKFMLAPMEKSNG